jgi:hypothetical protein
MCQSKHDASKARLLVMHAAVPSWLLQLAWTQPWLLRWRLMQLHAPPPCFADLREGVSHVAAEAVVKHGPGLTAQLLQRAGIHMAPLLPHCPHTLQALLQEQQGAAIMDESN